uniref:Uncharacterized protein n=1 Tax=Anguilla anguilla TaxID=7936 RepID=A0A0E9UB24_ANGAN
MVCSHSSKQLFFK